MLEHAKRLISLNHLKYMELKIINILEVVMG